MPGMRLWSLHPSYLDPKGLVALWREALLARAVLRGLTRGYRSHPQLLRFRAQAGGRSAVNAYLRSVADEATRRGYAFDRSKIGPVRKPCTLTVTRDQLRFELEHLRTKLSQRDPAAFNALPAKPRPHPLFRVVPGPIEAWEKQAE